MLLEVTKSGDLLVKGRAPSKIRRHYAHVMTINS